MGLNDYTQSTTATPEEIYRTWLKTTEKADRTQVLYEMYIKELTEFMESDINQIVAYHAEPANKGGLKRAFMDFMKYQTLGIEKNGEFKIRGRTLARSSAESYLKGLNAVLEANDLPKIKLDKYTTSTPKAKSKIQREQVKEVIMNAGSQRARAIIFLLKDSGLRVGDIVKLEVEDFLKAQVIRDDKGREFRKWRNTIVTEKTGADAQIVLGYESVNAIKLHLGDRRTGRILVQVKRGIGDNLNSKALTSNVRWLCKEVNQKGYNVSAHSFRKLFITNMSAYGVPLEMVKMMVGKTVPKTDATYLQYQDELVTKYMEAYPLALALDETASEVEQLKAEIEIMSEQNRRFADEMTSKTNSVIADLLAEMAELRKQVNQN